VSKKERTLVLLKPDAIQRGLAGNIVNRIESRGLKIVAIRLLKITKDLANKHYAAHVDKAFFGPLIQSITSSPVIAIIFEGSTAIETVRKTMGDTDPTEASPGTIRGDMGVDIGHNLIHGSDSLEAAKKKKLTSISHLMTLWAILDQ
jgi:nucleoside-diphosphate kinase